MHVPPYLLILVPALLLGSACSETDPDTLPPPDHLTGNCDLSELDAYDYYFVTQTIEDEPTKIVCVAGTRIDSLLFGRYTFERNVGSSLFHLNGGTVLQLHTRIEEPFLHDLVVIDASETRAEVIPGVPGRFAGAAYDEMNRRLYVLSHNTNDITDIDPPFTHFVSVFDANLTRIAQHSFETEETYFRARNLDVHTEKGLLVVSYQRWVPAYSGPGVQTEATARIIVYDWLKDEIQLPNTVFEHQFITDLFISLSGRDLLFGTHDLTPNRDDRAYRYHLNTDLLEEVVVPSPRPDAGAGPHLVYHHNSGKYYYNVFDEENTFIYEISSSGVVGQIHQESGLFWKMWATEEGLCLYGGNEPPLTQQEETFYTRLSLPDFVETRRDTARIGSVLRTGGLRVCR